MKEKIPAKWPHIRAWRKKLWLKWAPELWPTLEDLDMVLKELYSYSEAIELLCTVNPLFKEARRG